MATKIYNSSIRSWCGFGLAALAGGLAIGTVFHFGTVDTVQAADTATATLEPAFEEQVRPFLKKNCVQCHSVDTAIAGIRLDQMNAGLEDRHLKLWEAVLHRVSEGTMPPKGMPQPSSTDRQNTVAWITRALDIARSRPTPKNGVTRRLTISQYRNTLRELLHLEDNLTEGLPPDAVSKDGFVNNKETLQLNPLLTESYFEIAEEALNRAIVDPKTKPAVQNFRLDFGESINKAPLKETLILGAGSKLLENKDFTVTQLKVKKPFPVDHFMMKTKYRFIEGYQGNDTVRGWREYDSIYHSVFADMRGSGGYPKGLPYSTVPQGLLLRPAIPNDEMFTADGTYGPKANFKISLRELPDQGRFRVVVTAAKYNDGLLLNQGTKEQAASPEAITVSKPNEAQTINVKQAGVYQVDVYAGERSKETVAPDTSRLNDGLSLALSLDGTGPGTFEGEAKYVDSPFGKGLSLGEKDGAFVLPRSEAINVGSGEFTVAMWVHPTQLKRAGLISLGAHDYLQGWNLQMADPRGILRLEAAGFEGQPIGTISSPIGALRPNAWQHIAAVVQRGSKETRLYVNGFAVAKGEIGGGTLDNLKLPMHLGRLPKGPQFKGDMDEVRLYRRALSEAEIQALVEPGRQFVKAPPPERTQEVTVSLGERRFAGSLPQAAFVAVRLEAGPLQLSAKNSGVRPLERIVLTPLPATQETAKQFLAFEKRSPRVGVHLGLRRDCGSTFAPVEEPKTVSSLQPARFVFEGAIRNFPSPDVEKDNVNYLAGIREIAVRSEYTDGRDMPQLVIKSVEFEGPLYESWPPASHKSIFGEVEPKTEQKAQQAANARKVIRDFATRAFRRPITPREETSLLSVFTKSQAAGATYQQSIKEALQVVLTAPQFLFLIEKSVTPDAETLTDTELASKLSYFLWNGPPDKQTLQLASTGTLRKQLDKEVDRMIADPRFANFSREFTSQWLSLDKFAVLEPDRQKFPKLSQYVRAQLKQEPIEFVAYLIRNNLPAKNLISSDFVMANEVVASYYDMPEKTENGFQFMPIKHGRRELGGVLTQPAMMAGLSDGRESNPVKRGAWVARKIVAEPPNDPPPNVPALKESSEGLTLRQRLEQHRNQPGCQKCHASIDPWGVALEEFDAGGRLKKQPVDARSTLPDKTEVNGLDDLRRYLAQDRIDQVAFSVFKHLATYASGRSLTYNELNYLKKDGLKLKASGYRMKDMIRYVVNSKTFLEK